MKYINLLNFTISLILSYIGSPMLLKMLSNSQTLSSNYKNEDIPICMGLLFVFVQIISISFTLLLLKANSINIVFYLFAFTVMGMVGLLDDLIGDKNVKGLKGHIKSFFRGTLTTGGIKAGMGLLIALFISTIISNNFSEIMINTFLIALFTNLTNLFDLRPGRSIKVFILLSIIMLFSSNIKEYDFLLYSFYGILFVYFPLDLKAKAMMGDVGSNVLGITLGVYCALTHTIVGKLIYLVTLIVIHIIAEKLSFSKIIENNKILNYLDNLGR